MRDWIHTALLFVLTASCFAQQFFDSGGIKIRYSEQGRGQPVVLIHGWMVDSSMWARVGAALAPEFRVITLDCRGHGQSDKPHDAEAYGSHMAEDVVRLLDHLKVPKAHLVGYSMGAILAGRVVADHPERILSVTFAGAAPVLEWRPDDLKETDAFLKKWNEDTAFRAVSRLLVGERDQVALTAANRSLRQVTVSAAELRTYRGPVLFVHGSKDWPSTSHYVAAARQVLDQAELRVIPGADHLSTPSNPEFAAAVLKFLRANSQ